MTDFPDWWRGQRPPAKDDSPFPGMSGPLMSLDLDAIPPHASTGHRPVRFFRARARGLELRLDDVHLAVRWSEFDGCTFRQRVRPVLNERGYAAQGALGGPAIYRSCTFERVRFKLLGGFSLGRARFEDCTFRNCRWEGHFAHSADLVGCTFIGKMNGCVWFGEERSSDSRRRNEITGNDFTQTVFTDNVGWRFDFPLADQLFPDGFQPRVDG